MLFNLDNYSTSPLAIQTFLTSMAVLCLGLFALIRERRSRVSVFFLVLTMCSSVWLLAFSCMYSSINTRTAFWWAKTAYIGIAFVPAAMYHFSALVLSTYNKIRRRVWAVWILSAFFLTVILTTDTLFGSLYHYRWGYYPKYRWLSIPFLTFLFFVLIDVLRRYWLTFRRAPESTVQQLRARALFGAFSIAYLALFDFVATFGVPLYPFGYLAVLTFAVLTARAVVRYSFVDITPAFAAKQIIRTMNDALIVLDKEGVIRLANKAAGILLDAAEKDLIGKSALRAFPSGAFPGEYEKLLKTGDMRSVEVDFDMRNGEKRYLSLSSSAMKDGTGKLTAIVCVARDITELKRAEKELRRERDRARKYFDIAGVMLIVIDAEQLVSRINAKGCEVLGCEEHEILGKNWFDHFIPQQVRADVKPVFEALMAGETRAVEYFENTVITKSGTERAIAWHNVVLHDTVGTIIGTLSSGEDITERKQAEGQIRYLAYYDGLTGLPNRTFYKELLDRALIYGKRYQKTIATLFIDLDYFKRINDTLGHTAGDDLLQRVSERLLQSLRKSDCVARLETDETISTVSRLGGDEFIVLLNNIVQDQDAALVASRILHDLSHPFTLESHEVVITASIGIALYPSDGEDTESLLKNADIAMYYAKNKGRNNYQFYNERMNTAALERLTLENDLRRAMEREEILLYYQPKLDVRSRRIIGMEALIRWQHPERGLISPADFIPLAEETGLIVPMGEWVLRTACAQNRAWQEGGREPLTVSVNLSSRQFEQKEFVEMVGQVLQKAGLDPRHLELELTESAIMEYPEIAAGILQDLKATGIRISIDDFGTGYSSLSYLKRFPVDYLKVDRAFIMNITTNSDDAAITTAIVAMAHSLNLTVVAEGVETEEQMAFLLELGCDEVQGYLFSRPLPAEEFVELLTSTEQRAAAKARSRPRRRRR